MQVILIKNSDTNITAVIARIEDTDYLLSESTFNTKRYTHETMSSIVNEAMQMYLNDDIYTLDDSHHTGDEYVLFDL